jgi:hypothetical protein
MRLAKALCDACLASIFFFSANGWAQSPDAATTYSMPRVEIHCAAGVCATTIDPSSLSPNKRSDLVGRGVDLSRPFLLRNLGKWNGAFSERTCYTMRSYLMRRDDQHSDFTRQVGYSVCEPSSTFDVRETFDPLR